MRVKVDAYEVLNRRGPSDLYPIYTALLRYREHMENEHNATQKDYGLDVLGWHKKNHPTCETLPSFEDAKTP